MFNLVSFYSFKARIIIIIVTTGRNIIGQTIMENRHVLAPVPVPDLDPSHRQTIIDINTALAAAVAAVAAAAPAP